MPLVPLPVITKLPPAANVPPIWRLPLVSAAVENSRLPRFPVTSPMPPKPLIAISVELLNDKPAFVPLKVPSLFVKSTESAKTAVGNARESSSSHSIRFINLHPPNRYFLLTSFSFSGAPTQHCWDMLTHFPGFAHQSTRTSKACRRL